MFLGTYEYTLDPKGRLFIPAKLREENQPKEGQFILTKGLEGCLYLYNPTVFRGVVLARLENLPVRNKQDVRAFKRLLLSGAQEVGLDELGRILIAKPLIQYASLKKDVSILGVGKRIELWAAAKWATYNKKAATTFQRLSRELEI